MRKTWRYLCTSLARLEADVNREVRNLGHRPRWMRYDAGNKGICYCSDCDAPMAARTGDTVTWEPQALDCRGAK